jgi:inosine-uridine nucleoside N-ribohydrolase
MTSPPRPILIDCDPGHDDAFAIWLAAANLDLVGVTTVHGNQSLSKVTNNALKVLGLAGLDEVPVHAGASAPLIGIARHAPGLHGDSGLDGARIPEPARSPGRVHAVDFIIEMSRQVEGLTLVATGPLTNVALALTRDPTLAHRLREISLMGGSTNVGNTTPVAEFNVWADPEAAKIVFDSSVPTRMVGLNLTRQAHAGQEESSGFRRIASPLATAAADLIDFLSQQVGRVFGLPGASLHDPCAVAWLIDSALIRGEMLHVDVELRGSLTRGMTICDQRHVGGGEVGEDETVVSSEEQNVLVGIDLDHKAFFELLHESVRRLSTREIQ